jgi:lysozyme family protein
MNDFEKALQFVFEHECEFKKGHYGDMDYVVSENVDNDPGGLTKWGLDQRSHKDVSIETLTKEQATEIYRKEYWERNYCDTLDWPLNKVHFDNCVNMGAGQAVKLLQRVCGAHDDGAWGPNTKAAVVAACKVRSAEVVAKQVIEKKREFYEKLAEAKPALAKFKQGWLNRTNDLEKAIV